MSNSPARNQFLQDCAAADIAPSAAAAELRANSKVRLNYLTPDRYVSVVWRYSDFLQSFYRADSLPDTVCLVFNRKGELIETA